MIHFHLHWHGIVWWHDLQEKKRRFSVCTTTKISFEKVKTFLFDKKTKKISYLECGSAGAGHLHLLLLHLLLLKLLLLLLLLRGHHRQRRRGGRGRRAERPDIIIILKIREIKLVYGFLSVTSAPATASLRRGSQSWRRRPSFWSKKMTEGNKNIVQKSTNAIWTLLRLGVERA